jgi:hypothetical protein
MASMRQQAREFAEDAVSEAIDGLAGLIEHRIEWRRANAHVLALEAERMVYLLRTDPGRVWFRKARIATWRKMHRKHAARAWAADQALAAACRISCTDT